MALHIRKYHIGIGMLKRRRIFRSKDPHRIRSPSQITTSIHRSPITTHHMARIKRTPRQSYHIFRWYPGNPPSDDEAEAEADDVANELQPLPPPLPHPPGRSDDEDEDNVANELQPLFRLLFHIRMADQMTRKRNKMRMDQMVRKRNKIMAELMM